jgi:hypothetical protein
MELLYQSPFPAPTRSIAWFAVYCVVPLQSDWVSSDLAMSSNIPACYVIHVCPLLPAFGWLVGATDCLNGRCYVAIWILHFPFCFNLRSTYTRWFKYDRHYLCVNKSQFFPGHIWTILYIRRIYWQAIHTAWSDIFFLRTWLSIHWR